MHTTSKTAPIVLFVYNRLKQTMQTIKALRANSMANESELFIFSDAPKNEAAQKSVQAVREYLRTIDGFRQITIVERDSNLGLANSIINGVSSIIENYGHAIVLEDDLIASDNYLCFMNAALTYYENHETVFAISGYTGPLPSLAHYNADSYLSYRPASWGWATWKDRWDGIDWEVSDWSEFIKDRKKIKKFNRGGIDMTRMLKHCMEGKNNSWAIRWSYEMSKRDQYCVHPKVSKIQNIGFGEEATHCSGINIYRTDLDNSGRCTFDFTDATTPDPTISKEFRYQFSYTNKLIKKTMGYVQKAFRET